MGETNMLGINYFKAEPTEYARLSAGGKQIAQGKGIAKFYLPFRTSVEVLSLATIDQPFVFEEISSDKQPVTLQGAFVYEVFDPVKALQKYNFAINPATRSYVTEDYKKLPDLIVRMVQASARKRVQQTPLERLLVMSGDLSEGVSKEVSKLSSLSELGVRVDMLYFTAITPPAHIAKALEADYREGLQKKADEATYSRRAAAVEQEKAIQQNEMNNKIDLEEKRKGLVELQGANSMSEAKYKADAQKLLLGSFGGLDAEVIRAHALYQLGCNADKIECLTITPELMAGLNGALRAGAAIK